MVPRVRVRVRVRVRTRARTLKTSSIFFVSTEFGGMSVVLCT